MFTYKEQKRTGKFRSFQTRCYHIKLDKKVVGYIREPSNLSNEQGWGISFSIKKEVTKEEPAPFKWIFFTTRFETIDEAKEFLRVNFDGIIAKYDLYKFERDTL